MAYKAMKWMQGLSLIIFFALALPVASPTLAVAAETEHPEAKPFERKAKAAAQVDAALERAASNGKHIIVVMGANWCHDSRGLAGWFATKRFQLMLEPLYEIVYVDVGQKDRNIDIAQRYGIENIVGTPTVLVLSADGMLLNRETAPTWRNAASRSEEEIFTYFSQFTAE